MILMNPVASRRGLLLFQSGVLPSFGAITAAVRIATSFATGQSHAVHGQAIIRGGRANVRQALSLPALVAKRVNPKYTQLVAAGKPPKVAVTAIMRKLIVMANGLINTDTLTIRLF